MVFGTAVPPSWMYWLWSPSCLRSWTKRCSALSDVLLDVALVALLDVLLDVAPVALLDVLLDVALVALLDVLFDV